jgi:Uncharacterized proteins of the AP superfamily
MRVIVRVYIIVVLLLPCIAVPAQEVKHVVLISIDGFRPDFYREARWGAVNLQQMARKGVSADGVNPIFPSLTFPNHTTIITGELSARHGIYHNAPFSPDGKEVEWYWYEKDIQCPTLWDAVKKKGGVVVSVNWPVSVGAPVDYNITIVKKKGMTQLAATSLYATPAGLMEEVQLNATGKLDSISFNTNQDLLVVDENMARIAGYLIRTHKPMLTTLRVTCVDHFAHIEGREGDLVQTAVAGVDRAVRTILESLQRAGIHENSAVIVTGDHGFVTVHHSFSPNIILKKAGLLKDAAAGDWKAQFKPAGGAAFLYLKNSDDQKTLQQVIRLLKELPEYKEGKFRLIDRTQLDEAGCDPAAALALTAEPGYSFTASTKGSFVKAVQRGTHGYFPDFKEIQTGFVAFGAGLKQGVTIPVMSLTDVAPLVARLLKLPWSTTGTISTDAILKN